MPSKKEVLALLPAFGDERETVKWLQNTDDILNTIVETHGRFSVDYDGIYQLFDTGDVYSTCSELWDFCKYNLVYKEEPGSKQTVASPAAILRDGVCIDCKHYSTFIGGVLDAIRYHNNDGWDWCYRFASYNSDHEIGHVFVVVFDGNKEIWVDPVLGSFNERKKPTYYKDENRMLSIVSGIGGMGDTLGSETVTVGKKRAERDFLVAVNLDLFSIRDLLLNNFDVTSTTFRDWYQGEGFDYNQLMLLLSQKPVSTIPGNRVLNG